MTTPKDPAEQPARELMDVIREDMAGESAEQLLREMGQKIGDPQVFVRLDDSASISDGDIRAFLREVEEIKSKPEGSEVIVLLPLSESQLADAAEVARLARGDEYAFAAPVAGQLSLPPMLIELGDLFDKPEAQRLESGAAAAALERAAAEFSGQSVLDITGMRKLVNARNDAATAEIAAIASGTESQQLREILGHKRLAGGASPGADAPESDPAAPKGP